MKSFAILHNFIDNYNILIIFAIYQQTAKYQCIYKRHKIAIFKYCPGHTEIKSQLINNRLRFFICHCAATASPSPSPMADKRISACDRNKRLRQICRRRLLRSHADIRLSAIGEGEGDAVAAQWQMKNRSRLLISCDFISVCPGQYLKIAILCLL